jgi:hypothetical protein
MFIPIVLRKEIKTVFTVKHVVYKFYCELSGEV